LPACSITGVGVRVSIPLCAKAGAQTAARQTVINIVPKHRIALFPSSILLLSA